MHELLTKGYLINLVPLLPRNTRTKERKFDIYNKYADSDERNFQLAASSEYPLDRGINLELDYYRPEAKNFPMIDSLLLIRPANGPSPILLMFQMMRSQDGHDVKEAGLKILNGLKVPPGTRMYYVVGTTLC
jgi:hypothetical protein